MHPSCSASLMMPASRPATAACNSACATSPLPARTTATRPAATRSGWSSATKTPSPRRSRSEHMAVYSDRAAAWTSGSEETNMTTASGVANPVVSGTTPLPASSSGSSLNSTTGATLAGNFQTFLTLLTTQLQNQDPLSPLDTNQFTQQLVEFASVEQQVNMNSNLQTLISMQQTSASLQALQLVGANVTINSNTASLSKATGSPATWGFSSPAPATGAVTITSSTGQVAYAGTMP